MQSKVSGRREVAESRPRVAIRLNGVVSNAETSSVEEVRWFSRQLYLRQLAMYPAGRTTHGCVGR